MYSGVSNSGGAIGHHSGRQKKGEKKGKKKTVVEKKENYKMGYISVIWVVITVLGIPSIVENNKKSLPEKCLNFEKMPEIRKIPKNVIKSINFAFSHLFCFL